MIAHEMNTQRFLVNKRGYVQFLSKMVLFPSLWKENDRTHIIASCSAIGGAPFVQQSILKSLGGKHPCFFR